MMRAVCLVLLMGLLGPCAAAPKKPTLMEEKGKPLTPKEKAALKEGRTEEVILVRSPSSNEESSSGDMAAVEVIAVEDSPGFGPELPNDELTMEHRSLGRTDKSLKAYNQMMWDEISLVARSWFTLLKQVFTSQMRSSRALGMPDSVGTLTALSAVASTLTVGMGTFLREVGFNNLVAFMGREMDNLGRSLAETTVDKNGPPMLDRALDSFTQGHAECRSKFVCELERVPASYYFGRMALMMVNPYISGLSKYRSAVAVALNPSTSCRRAFEGCPTSIWTIFGYAEEEIEKELTLPEEEESDDDNDDDTEDVQQDQDDEEQEKTEETQAPVSTQLPTTAGTSTTLKEE